MTGTPSRRTTIWTSAVLSTPARKPAGPAFIVVSQDSPADESTSLLTAHSPSLRFSKRRSRRIGSRGAVLRGGAQSSSQSAPWSQCSTPACWPSRLTPAAGALARSEPVPHRSEVRPDVLARAFGTELPLSRTSRTASALNSLVNARRFRLAMTHSYRTFVRSGCPRNRGRLTPRKISDRRVQILFWRGPHSILSRRGAVLRDRLPCRLVCPVQLVWSGIARGRE